MAYNTCSISIHLRFFFFYWFEWKSWLIWGWWLNSGYGGLRKATRPFQLHWVGASEVWDKSDKIMWFLGNLPGNSVQNELKEECGEVGGRKELLSKSTYHAISHPRISFKLLERSSASHYLQAPFTPQLVLAYFLFLLHSIELLSLSAVFNIINVLSSDNSLTA